MRRIEGGLQLSGFRPRADLALQGKDADERHDRAPETPQIGPAADDDRAGPDA
jgi:hypothetical protein